MISNLFQMEYKVHQHDASNFIFVSNGMVLLYSPRPLGMLLISGGSSFVQCFLSQTEWIVSQLISSCGVNHVDGNLT